MRRKIPADGSFPFPVFDQCIRPAPQLTQVLLELLYIYFHLGLSMVVDDRENVKCLMN